jgi:crotonobetainyl-CoA:carnitine CoA-transferase CaiB-like acyl-CoA transferase
MPGVLEGVRVIDFGQYIAGPLAAVMLGDQGADVIHVDPPGGPRWQHPSDAFFNRGKRRVILDLKTPDGLDAAKKLIAGADVVIENFRPGVMQRLGLGAEDMTAADPRLIYVSMPGFAADDPRAELRAWEGIIDAATDNCRAREGEPPEDYDPSRPTYSAVPLASNFAGFLGAASAVMALIARERSGKGQRIDVPLYNAMFTLIGPAGAYPTKRGVRYPGGIHGRGAGCFRCGDGRYVQFDTSSARHLTWFANETGINSWGPDLLDPERLRNPENNQRLHTALRELFLTKSAEEWETLNRRAGGAMGFCRTTTEWLHTDHAQASKAVTHLVDPELGPTWMAGLPAILEDTPGAPGGPRSAPGFDNKEVLSSLDAWASRSNGTSHPEPGLKLPLEGLRVLDLCVALAGPSAGRLLGEYGADVIKIMQPQGGGMSGYLNRGKRTILLDLGRDAGRQVFWKLFEDADIVLENLSPGTADRLGIGYEQAKARKPDIIYASASCYGPGGPWTPGRGWERQGQAVAGIMERTGEIPAILGPYNLIDIGTGVLTTFATALGVYHKVRSGKGQHVHGSLSHTATYQQAPFMLDYKGHVSDEVRGYKVLGTSALQRFYKGSDGWFFLGATEEEARRVTLVAGLPSGEASEEALEAAFAKGERDQWVQRLREAGVSAHIWVRLHELMEDPWAREHGLTVTQISEEVGEVTMPGISVAMSGTPLRIGAPARACGADAESILEEAGLGDELTNLQLAWAVQTHNLPSAWRGEG